MSKKNNESSSQPTRQAVTNQNAQPQDTEFGSDQESSVTGVQTARAGLGANTDFSNVTSDTEFAAENGIQASAEAIANRNANQTQNTVAGQSQDTEFASEDQAYDPARQATLSVNNNNLSNDKQ